MFYFLKITFVIAGVSGQAKGWFPASEHCQLAKAATELYLKTKEAANIVVVNDCEVKQFDPNL